ncbi:MAG: DNA translocase FtsK [Candidatus Omnitrophica bacterium]|nr:DNA translocase FtsK [Candidatus Omnitrophota bacterium]
MRNGKNSKSNKGKIIKKILATVLLFLLGAFVFVSLATHSFDDHPFYSSRAAINSPGNATGIVGAFLSHYLFIALGWASFGIPLVLFMWAVLEWRDRVLGHGLLRWGGFFIFLSASACLLYLIERPPFDSFLGGFWGYFLGKHTLRYFGLIGGSLFTVALLITSLFFITDFMILSFFYAVWKSLKEGLIVSGKGVLWMIKSTEEFLSAARARKIELARAPEPKKERAKLKEAALSADKDKDEKKPRREPPPPKVTIYEPSVTKAKKAKEAEDLKSYAFDEAGEEKTLNRPKAEKPKIRLFEPKIKNEGPEAKFLPRPVESRTGNGQYAIPTLDLLEVPKAANLRDGDALEESSKLLEATFKDFDIDVRVTEVKQGPVVTRYEILPAPGVKVSSIVSLQDDIALALKAASVRMIAPIPGKSAVGIEVPNSVTTVVYLRELLESKEYLSGKHRLPLTLGKDVSGKNLVADLAEMPHLLIAGTTGSGKTVCINSIIAGLLFRHSPEDLRLVMIDPKMVELAVYNKLPHMLAPVVTDVKKAAATLNWVVSEMERRYKLFANVGVRNIQTFNTREKSKEPVLDESGIAAPEKLPYIIVMIDELADLMVMASDKVETAITRLAQLSRAVGIHLLLATQRPSVDVITGVIKANFPARISFKVASKVDSRTVLDLNGADKLLGKGDMLFLEPGSAKPTRAQCTLTTDAEINRIVQFIQGKTQPNYVEEVEKVGEGSSIGIDRLDKDELYDDAVRVVLETKQASVSILQRRLRLGYSRAARIIDMMEANGVVGPFQGSKPRDILVKAEPQPQ